MVTLFQMIGSADIDDHGYQLCGWMTPHGFYDPVTAEKLGGLLIVGLGSTGACEAYDPEHGWQFGTITETCRWWPDDGTTPSLLDFLEQRYLGSG